MAVTSDVACPLRENDTTWPLHNVTRTRAHTHVLLRRSATRRHEQNGCFGNAVYA